MRCPDLRWPMLAAAGCAGFAAPAWAQRADTAPVTEGPSSLAETQQQPKTPTTLTGEWGGLRTRIRDAGIDLTAGYTSEFAANVSGGRRRDATETGQFTFGARVDTQALAGWPGGTLQTSITYRRGHDLDQRAGLQTLQQVQEVYGRGQTWRLTELWYSQQIGRFDLKVGRLPQGADFASFTCTFQNLAFCGAPPGNIAGDYWYNWPVSQWGGRLRYRERHWYVMVGAYENNPRNLDNGFFLSRRGAKGVLAPVEIGWTPELGPRRLPGSYRIGAWYNSANAPDVLLDVNRRPAILTGAASLERGGRSGFFILAQQQLTGSYIADGGDGPRTTHGLKIFVNFTRTDRRTERVESQLAAGLLYYGLFAFRPKDSLGLAVARTHVNGRAERADRLASPGNPALGSEYEVEFHYTLRLRPWLALRPNVQYVVDPGGNPRLDDVVVLGMKSAVTF